MGESHDAKFSLYSNPSYVLLHFYDPMRLVINGEEIITDNDACIIYTPDTLQEYSLYSGDFHNDYVWFRLEDKAYLEQFGLPLNKPFYCNNIGEISGHIAHITWALTDVLVDHSELLDRLFCNCLCLMRDNLIISTPKLNRDHMMRRQFGELRSKVSADPAGWTIEKMAKSVYLTRSHFSVHYRSQFGITPSEDLKRFVMNKAKELLSEGDLSIGEIAEKLGYSNSENFIRAFKKSEGITPLKYRSKRNDRSR